ncbi:MAG: DUF354 domain-containing protein, partial [Candidatus Heimdallarchaeota archaeon]|nr:DUF354 domain-containing protein [Candidatus Heimdallarchaeota archaeon]
MDSLTGKQALLVDALAKLFENRGHEVIITSRPYSIDRSNQNLDRVGRKHFSIGDYGGNLKSWLINGSERIAKLTNLMDEEKPDLLISFPSPDAFRTAFGLGIPSIQMNDTPHATAVGRLTISLAAALVHSDAIRSEDFARLGVTKYYTFAGIDEALWIKDFQPNENVLRDLSIRKGNYVVIRCEESKASYYRNLFPDRTPGSTDFAKLIDHLRLHAGNLDIVAFPRYPEQERELFKLGVVIPEQSVDTLSLLYYARALITGGGTMSREAALLGTPTIYTFPKELAVSRYLSELGFPIYHFPHDG